VESEVKNWLLTGKPGLGKTTLLRSLLPALKAKVGGFFTEEIREEGERVGFYLRDLEGKEGILAHISFSRRCRVGRYGVRVETMEEIGVPALRRAIAAQDVDLVVLDEIGRMELFCRPFWEEIFLALDSPKPVIGVLQQRALSLFPGLRERKDTRILEVTLKNRDHLGEVILQELRRSYPQWVHLEG
jgi:nucleoside-triphosphatase